jgi:hypothetical protein
MPRHRRPIALPSPTLSLGGERPTIIHEEEDDEDHTPASGDTNDDTPATNDEEAKTPSSDTDALVDPSNDGDDDDINVFESEEATNDHHANGNGNVKTGEVAASLTAHVPTADEADAVTAKHMKKAPVVNHIIHICMIIPWSSHPLYAHDQQ